MVLLDAILSLAQSLHLISGSVFTE